MTTEQRRALANTTPTTEIIRDAVTYPRDRLGEPLDISGPRFDAWLAQVKRDAAREALDGLADEKAAEAQASWLSRNALYWLADETRQYRDTHYPEDVTP